MISNTTAQVPTFSIKRTRWKHISSNQTAPKQPQNTLQHFQNNDSVLAKLHPNKKWTENFEVLSRTPGNSNLFNFSKIGLTSLTRHTSVAHRRVLDTTTLYTLCNNNILHLLYIQIKFMMKIIINSNVSEITNIYINSNKNLNKIKTIWKNNIININEKERGKTNLL